MRNSDNSATFSLLLCFVWTFMLIAVIIQYIKGEQSPSWICVICPVACCALHSLNDFIDKRF